MTIYHRARATGVDGRLLAFLDWWETHGPFPLLVLTDGGIRWDEERQTFFFKTGRSRAATLSETAHGRGGAIDAAPYVNGKVPWHDWDFFECYGEAAEQQGLVWGGRWTKLRDGPHIEVPNWRALPFPPPTARVLAEKLNGPDVP